MTRVFRDLDMTGPKLVREQFCLGPRAVPNEERRRAWWVGFVMSGEIASHDTAHVSETNEADLRTDTPWFWAGWS